MFVFAHVNNSHGLIKIIGEHEFQASSKLRVSYRTLCGRGAEVSGKPGLSFLVIERRTLHDEN